MLSLDLKQMVLQAARSEPALVRSQVRDRVLILLFASALIALTVFFAIGGVRMGPRPIPLIIATSGGALAFAIAALVIALGRGKSMLGRPRTSILAMAMATPAVLLLWKMIWSARYDGMMVEWPTRIGLRCLGWSLLMAAAPLLAMVWARRRSDPVHPMATGAGIGVAAGAVSWVFVDLWCPVAFPGHLLIGHVLPIALLAAAGLWLGARIIAIRARASAP